MKINAQNIERIFRFSVLGLIAISGASAIAAPTLVYVHEESIVNAGTSYLGLPLLQSNGSVSYQIWDVYVGSFNIGVSTTISGSVTNELAFCVDPWNWSGSGTMPYLQQNLTQVVTSQSSTFDIQQLAVHESRISALYSNDYQDTIGNTEKSAAFQIALWEIVSDNAVSEVGNSNSKIWNDGEALLSQLESSNFKMGSQNYDITAYYVQRDQPGYQTLGQNYLVATPVPEPATLALLSVGLAGISMTWRKKTVAVTK